MEDGELARVLDEQIAYYRARAGEYDEWFLRQGRYDRGPEANARWFAEVETVARALEAFRPVGRVLELAAGTGLWTQRLARHAARVTAVDSAGEALALNRQRLGDSASVEYVEADVFAWRPAHPFDVIFFSFWLSHVPPERFAVFWDGVRQSLAPGGRVFVIDSRYTQESTARDHALGDSRATRLTRRLNDGRSYKIVKVFYEPHELEQRLAAQGWRAAIATSGQFFLYGTAELV
ncbi:MAG: class I SAM-dependent methyltransferase [Ktedonobacterales bacterium]